MGERIFELLRGHFQHHGYWTVAVALLLENAGIPIPGETVLLFASFLAFSEKQLHLCWILVTATLACTAGDNLGYTIGRCGGRRLLDRWKHLFLIKQKHLDHGERLFARFGAFAIFFARFVFGMRIMAGPVAGVLRMPWKQFAVFNFLGAAVWVTVVSLIGYLFGQHWSELLRLFRDFNVGIVVVLALASLAVWRGRCRR
jgi:membrane-associated protein